MTAEFKLETAPVSDDAAEGAAKEMLDGVRGGEAVDRGRRADAARKGAQDRRRAARAAREGEPRGVGTFRNRSFFQPDRRNSLLRGSGWATRISD